MLQYILIIRYDWCISLYTKAQVKLNYFSVLGEREKKKKTCNCHLFDADQTIDLDLIQNYTHHGSFDL